MEAASRRLVVEFTKMTGAGNDFIVIDNRFYHFSDAELAALTRRYAPRRTGIGADGLLAFDRPDEAAHHFRMRYLNADGSPGTMCGNGARCLARFARLAGLEDTELTFETDAGLYRAWVPDEGDVRLFVPDARDFRPNLLVAGLDGPVHYLWTGTEHLVRYVAEVAVAPVETEGPRLRHDRTLSPRGANVNFVEVVEDGPAEALLRVRTFEKGVEAETLACGTGATASALVSCLLGRVAASTVAVSMPGGTLRVGFQRHDGRPTNLWLEGPAEAVFRGTVEM